MSGDLVQHLGILTLAAELQLRPCLSPSQLFRVCFSFLLNLVGISIKQPAQTRNWNSMLEVQYVNGSVEVVLIMLNTTAPAVFPGN